MSMIVFMLAAGLAGGCGSGGARASDVVVRVRATPAVAPCVEAAGRAYSTPSRRVVVDTGRLADGAAVDVLVGAAAEVTRALEGGAAVTDSDAEVGRVPWLLVVPAGNPQALRGLPDVDRAGVEVWVAGGPAAHEARRALQKLAPERVREASDGAVPRGAAAALAPLCLAGPGERLAVDVPELVVQAAVSAGAARPGAARDFVAYLTSAAGRRAFAAVP